MIVNTFSAQPQNSETDEMGFFIREDGETW